MASIRKGRLALAVVIVALAAVVVPFVPPAAAASPEDDLEAAQNDANRAAADLADAEEDMARAQDGLADLQGRVDRIDARVSEARERVGALAVRLYVQGTVPVVRILRMANAGDVVRVQQYSSVVAATSTDALEQFRAEREDLGRERAALADQQEVHAAAIADLQERRDTAVGEIDRLSEVVAKAAAARDAERRAQALAAAGNSASASAAASSPASPAAAPPSSATGDAPAPPPVLPDGAAPSGDWICPVQGPHAFSNDYGAPRGGGYTHQGNDILAPRGTPVVASVDGEVRQRSGAVSGLAYYLDGDNGDQYFGAHLDSFGESGRVTAGTVVGYVGNTGDAASTATHLHFEIHPGGSGYENPYATLIKYC
jgi:murein DD-endopeptidase MepM/ murein hydrolase activator NlpD